MSPDDSAGKVCVKSHSDRVIVLATCLDSKTQGSFQKVSDGGGIRRNCLTQSLRAAEGGQTNDDSSGQSGTVVDRRVKAEKPKMYKVLLHNDDYTPMEFVIEVLEKFFHKTHAQATEIMLTVHHEGKGLCGVFPFEVAETKVALVNESAREHEHPLQCSMEKD